MGDLCEKEYLHIRHGFNIPAFFERLFSGWQDGATEWKQIRCKQHSQYININSLENKKECI